MFKKRYYRILPEGLNVNGFQLQEGLNTDPDFLKDNGLLRGLYFADKKHVLHFCCDGTLIAEVEIPKDAAVQNFDEYYQTDKLILRKIQPLFTLRNINRFLTGSAKYEEYCFNAICQAALINKAEILWFLIKKVSDKPKALNQALLHATFGGHLQLVQELIKRGADIHYEDDFPLCAAASHGYLHIVRYLLDNGAKLNTRDGDAIIWASSNGHLGVVKCLVEHGVDVQIQCNSAIQMAASNGHVEVVKYLIEHGADVHDRDDLALRLAAARIQKDIVQLIESL